MKCRACGSETGAPLVSYPSLPVSGCYVKADSQKDDPCRPFSVVRCQSCQLVQLQESLETAFYEDYRFMGDVGEGYSAHLQAVSDWIGRCWSGHPRVVEVGASNGSLLALLKSSGATVSGFEPAVTPARRAQARGLDVRVAPLTPQTAAPLASQADVVVIRHVLEHIDDLERFMEGVNALAHEGTRLVIEVPDLPSTVIAGLQTNFYHPHLSYFDRRTLSALLARFGWRVDVARIVDIFGGSLLVGASRAAEPALIWPEPPGVSCHAISEATVSAFFADWSTSFEALRAFLDKQRAMGRTIDGYGAAERTVAALGFAEVGPQHIRRLYDRNPLLWGWCVPGSRIPILSSQVILEDPPDLMVIFASSHEREIMAQQVALLERGCRFVSLRGAAPRVIDHQLWRTMSA